MPPQQTVDGLLVSVGPEKGWVGSEVLRCIITDDVTGRYSSGGWPADSSYHSMSSFGISCLQIHFFCLSFFPFFGGGKEALWITNI